MAEPAALTHAFMRMHPAEAAQVIEAVPPAEAAALFVTVPVRLGATVLGAMLPAAAARCVAALEEERAMALLGVLGAQPAVLVLRHIAEPRRARLIAGLPTAAALASRLLLGYAEDSAGAWADPDVIALPGETRAAAALERVRLAESPAERLFVLGPGKRLTGSLALAVLLRAPPEAPLDSLMTPIDAVLAAQTPLAGAATHPGWQRGPLLPVVDSSERLLGVLTSDALSRALRRAARRPSVRGPESIAGVLALGYWEALLSLVEAAATLLPSVPPVGGDRER